MKISPRVRLLITFVVMVAIAGTTAALILIQRTSRESAAASFTPSAIADVARVLDSAPKAEVTVTEFLDFECEACGQMYPVVEELRTRYAGQVAFTFRYFPLPGHRNSTTAARAVEAAAQQGKLAPMYRKLFDTQAQWGESSTSQADRFRVAADQLGLDLARYDQDLAGAAVAARVRSDSELGRAAGVTGTPTFFINGIRVELQQASDLETAIQRQLAG